jgi:hypothetical protein
MGAETVDGSATRRVSHPAAPLSVAQQATAPIQSGKHC